MPSFGVLTRTWWSPVSLITRVDASVDELRAADIVVVLADHAAFDLDDVQRFAAVVLDTRHCMPVAGTSSISDEPSV